MARTPFRALIGFGSTGRALRHRGRIQLTHSKEAEGIPTIGRQDKKVEIGKKRVFGDLNRPSPHLGIVVAACHPFTGKYGVASRKFG